MMSGVWRSCKISDATGQDTATNCRRAARAVVAWSRFFSIAPGLLVSGSGNVGL